MTMTRKGYTIREIFLSVQGEGFWSGTRAVFVRTVGCTVWSGLEEERVRDVARGCCAEWCDTNFRGTDGANGGVYSAPELAAKVRELWGSIGNPLVVVTGGEPTLMIDDALVAELQGIGARVHVESNGSRRAPKGIDWLTLSPKPPMPVVDQHYDEVKVVVPAVDPLKYADRAEHRFVQPLDHGDRDANMRFAVDFVLANPGWRLSLQTHKLAGLP